MTPGPGPVRPDEPSAAPLCVRDANDHIRRLLAPLAPAWSFDEPAYCTEGIDDEEDRLEIEIAKADHARADLELVRSPYIAFIAHPTAAGPRFSTLTIASAKPRSVPITYDDITAAVHRLVGRVMVEQAQSVEVKSP